MANFIFCSSIAKMFRISRIFQSQSLISAAESLNPRLFMQICVAENPKPQSLQTILSDLQGQNQIAWNKLRDSGVIHASILSSYCFHSIHNDLTNTSELTTNKTQMYKVLRQIEVNNIPTNHVKWDDVMGLAFLPKERGRDNVADETNLPFLKQCLRIIPSLLIENVVEPEKEKSTYPCTPDIIMSAMDYFERVGRESDLLDFLFSQEASILKNADEIDETLKPSLIHHHVFLRLFEIMHKKALSDARKRENWIEAVSSCARVLTWMDPCSDFSGAITDYLREGELEFAFNLFKMTENQYSADFIAGQLIKHFSADSAKVPFYAKYLISFLESRFPEKELEPFTGQICHGKLSVIIGSSSSSSSSGFGRKSIIDPSLKSKWINEVKERAFDPNFFTNCKAGSKLFVKWITFLACNPEYNEILAKYADDLSLPWDVSSISVFIRNAPSLNYKVSHLDKDSLERFYHNVIIRETSKYPGRIQFAENFIVVCCLKNRLDLAEDYFCRVLLSGKRLFLHSECFHPIFATISGRRDFIDGVIYTKDLAVISEYLKWIKVLKFWCGNQINRRILVTLTEPFDGKEPFTSAVRDLLVKKIPTSDLLPICEMNKTD